MQQQRLAASVARTISDSEEKAEALYNVAMAYVRDKFWEQAEEISGEIGDEKIHEKACGDIAKEYANAGQWKHTQAIFNKIHHAEQRRAVL